MNNPIQNNSPQQLQYQNAAYQQASSPQFGETMTRKERLKRKRIKIAASVLIAVLIVAAILFYFMRVVPSRPENKIAKAFAELIDSESLAVDVDINLELDLNGAVADIEVPIKYDYDGQKTGVFAQVGGVKFSTNGYTDIAGYEPQSLEIEPNKVGFNSIFGYQDNQYSVKASGLSSVSPTIASLAEQSGLSEVEVKEFMGEVDTIISEIDNTWVAGYFDRQPSFAQLGHWADCISDKRISSTQQMKEIYLSNQFIQVEKQEDVGIEGASAKKYTVSFKSKEYSEFKSDISSLIAGDQSLSQCSDNLAQNWDYFKDLVDLQGEQVLGNTFEVWLSDKDEVQKVSLTKGQFAVEVQLRYREAATIDTPLDAINLAVLEGDVGDAVDKYETSLTIDPIEVESEPELVKRDSQRKNDALRLIATMENYADDNLGKYPQDKTEMQDAIVEYMSSQKFIDPTTKFAYSVSYTDFSPKDLGDMHYSASAYCSEENYIFAASSTDKKSIAVEVKLEEGSFCIDNQ